MKTKRIENKIIIIGGDHHNTLAVIRDLGMHKCDIMVLVHGEFECEKKIRVARSKYAKNRTFFVNSNEYNIYEWLISNRKDTKLKIILFPCSDLAAYTIDTHYEDLSKFYILPGFTNSPGRVAYLMNKRNQKKFADENGIPMAKTWELIKIDRTFKIPDDMIYPCIVKPEVSAFGMKQDIKICKSNKELTDALEVFSNKNYESIIVQQFLEKKYEVCSYGCLINQHPYEVDIEHMKEIGGSVQKVREWPSTGGGSTVFAQFIDNDDLNDLKNCVLVILYQQGYRGQYDIEFLVCEDKIYLNEINFRHSGNGYGLIENGVSAPYIWCLDCAGEPIPKNIKINVIAGACHMDEMSDFSHRKGNHLTLHEWIKNVRKTKAFAVFNYKDLSGTWGFYRVKLKNAIKKLIK